MNSEYAVSHEENSDDILELIYTDEDGTTFYRENGQWIEIDPEGENPTVFDIPLIFVTEDFVPFYDENDELTVSDTSPYHEM